MTPTTTPPAATVQYRVTVWGYDPAWNRVEAFDADGVSLGVVTFEPRPGHQPAASSGLSAQMRRISASFRSTVRRLAPVRPAISALS